MSALPSFFSNKLNLLKQISIFHGLNWFVLNRITRHVEIIEYNKGDIICRQGAPADAFYALASGRVYSYVLNAAGQKEEVDFILRGMHFGIISTLTGENHSRTYEAANDSIVLKINKDNFSQILKTAPQLALALSQSLSKRIRSHFTHTSHAQESTIIAVYGPVAGAGSSTYAAHLSLTLKQETQKKVLLLSLSCNSSDPRPDLADMDSGHDSIFNHIIQGVLPVDLLSVKFDIKNTTLMRKVTQFVTALVNDYRYIVLDLPNEMDELVMKTMAQSDAIHLVAIDCQKDLEACRHVIDRLSDQLKERFHAESILVIISGVNTENRMMAQEIKKILNYDVFLVLPHLQPTEFAFKQVTPGFSFVEIDAKSEYAQTIRRQARQIGNVRLGLALGGGAALGLAHIGVIRVLEREGIPVDMVVGSSMGALIASLWACGYNADEMEKFGREFESKWGILNVFDPIVPVGGLIGGEGIRYWLKTKLGAHTFLDVKIPLRVVVYDLFHRKEMVVSDGSLVDAVRKSVAIPGVMRPVIEGKQMLIDGGVLNPLPTNVLKDMGIRKIIAVNVLQSPQEVDWGQKLEEANLKVGLDIPFLRHPLKFVGFRLGRLVSKIFMPNIADIIVRTLQATEYVLAEQSAKEAHVLIHPDLKGISWFELYAVNELIKRGEDAAIKALPAIKELVSR